MSTDDVRISHNSAQTRYELWVGDELGSVADYRPSDGHLVFHHTETAGRFRGRGLAARVVQYALDDVRTQGLKVVPTCWFVADFIEAHPEYEDLLHRREDSTRASGS